MQQGLRTAIPAIALVLALSAVAVTSASGFRKTGSSSANVIVVFKSPQDKDPELIESLGGKITGSVDIIPAIFAEVPGEAIKALKEHPKIKYVEPDHKARALGILNPPQKGKKNGEKVPQGIKRIHAQEAAAKVNEDYIDVAILDTGIDYQHEDLNANVEKGVSTVGWFTKEGKFWGDDHNGHGTHCAGIVAAEHNDVGVVGVGPMIDLYAVKVLSAAGFGTYSDLIEGIDWSAKNKAEVISMSLGGDEYSMALEDACNEAYAKGVVFVAAAGNDGDGNPNTNEVCYPAKYDSVIAVAATNKNDETPKWSSEGAEVEEAAPGVDILSTWKNNKYEKHSGTSMACPHVSGTAALILAANSNLAPKDVRSILHETSIDIETPGKDKFSGYGLIQADYAVAKALSQTIAGCKSRIGQTKDCLS